MDCSEQSLSRSVETLDNELPHIVLRVNDDLLDAKSLDSWVEHNPGNIFLTIRPTLL